MVAVCLRWSGVAIAFVAAACGGDRDGAPASTPGAGRTGVTTALETAASAVQAKAPVGQISMYLSGFHPAKDDPSTQMESHHYCNQVNEDFAQCVLFDGNTADARLHGIEYIISATLYGRLPAEERAYWHPHNYEILSGALRMPGVPSTAEQEALARKINSYGKTWHTWMAGVHGRPADELPYGPPHLGWSFNHDGEMAAGLLEARDARLLLDTQAARRDRGSLVTEARPQAGVDLLRLSFPDATPVPGVADNGDPAARPVPRLTLDRPAGARDRPR